MEKADFLMCHMDMSAVDSVLFPPLLSPTLLSPPSSLKVVITVFSHRLIINISDLLFPHINADCIYSSDLTWVIESYILQIICQFKYSILDTYHQERVFLPKVWI